MKKIISMSLVAALVLTLAGCNWFEKKLGDLKEALVGREMIIQTYDENSQLIDRVQGKSVSIKADDEFELTDVDGNVVEKSSVLNVRALKNLRFLNRIGFQNKKTALSVRF